MSSKPKGKIIVTGILFWYPLAGVTYQFLHYMLGLRNLGYDAYYIEDSGRYVYDATLNDLSPDAANNVAAVQPALDKLGFKGKWAFRGAYEGGKCYGMTHEQILKLYAEADAILNVTGAQELRDEHMQIPMRVFVESDPFAMQVKVVNGDRGVRDFLAQHTHHFTFGENIGASDCGIPKTPFTWQPTRQPVAMELWDMLPPVQSGQSRYNTITTWKNKGKDVVHNGETYYWTKDREFEKYMSLPTQRKGPFELATLVPDDIRTRLVANKWLLADSFAISKDWNSYRAYIQHSRGEFTVARDQYVRPRDRLVQRPHMLLPRGGPTGHY